VQVVDGGVYARHLNRRHQRDPVRARGLVGLGDAVDRVVVGEGQRRHPGFRCRGDHPAGRQLAVGEGRMRLQVEHQARDYISRVERAR
jgi:hypothetical protein